MHLFNIGDRIVSLIHGNKGSVIGFTESGWPIVRWDATMIGTFHSVSFDRKECIDHIRLDESM